MCIYGLVTVVNREHCHSGGFRYKQNTNVSYSNTWFFIFSIIKAGEEKMVFHINIFKLTVYIVSETSKTKCCQIFGNTNIKVVFFVIGGRIAFFLDDRCPAIL